MLQVAKSYLLPRDQGWELKGPGVVASTLQRNGSQQGHSQGPVACWAGSLPGVETFLRFKNFLLSRFNFQMLQTWSAKDKGARKNDVLEFLFHEKKKPSEYVKMGWNVQRKAKKADLW